jgi:Undecaprenyl-phosphate glucose phosphotransferase
MEAPRRGARLEAALLYKLIALADWALLAGFAAAAGMISLQTPVMDLTLAQILPFICCAMAMKLGLWAASAYHQAPAKAQAGDAFIGLMVAAGALLLLLLALKADARLAATLAVLAPSTALLISFQHLVASRLLRSLSASGALSETAIVVGATEEAERFLKRNAETGSLNVVAIFDDRTSRGPGQLQGVPVVGDIDALLSWPHLPEIDQIIVTVNPSAESRVRDLIDRLRLTPNRVVLLFDLAHLALDRAHVSAIANTPAAIVSGGPRNPRFAMLKRAQDLVLGGVFLAILAIPMALIALWIRLDSAGPIIFKQRRHGFNNRIITVYKFRTMRYEPVQIVGPVRQVTANDPRVTRAGRILRSTSLDELPQLINVLAGDMSLVGPRPHAVGMRTGEVDSHRIVAEYAHRHRMKPGMTGWAQVNGSRGPLDTAAQVRERVRLDLEYIEKSSLWFDLWIILRTLPALLGDKLAIR